MTRQLDVCQTIARAPRTCARDCKVKQNQRARLAQIRVPKTAVFRVWAAPISPVMLQSFGVGVICMPYLRLDTGHWPIGLSSVRFKEVSARFPDKSAQVDDDFAFALEKFALTPFADCLGDCVSCPPYFPSAQEPAEGERLQWSACQRGATRSPAGVVESLPANVVGRCGCGNTVCNGF